MQANNIKEQLHTLIDNTPADWLNLTTHRLDIYDEKLAKTQFLTQLESLFKSDNTTLETLSELPTAFDYIRLGHPLSCVLEWGIAQIKGLSADQVISFDSKTIPMMAVMRKNLLDQKKTLIAYTGELPICFDAQSLRDIYGYQFDLKQVSSINDIPSFDGSVVFVASQNSLTDFNLDSKIDFFIGIYGQLGSVLIVNGAQNQHYISEIQHVRRRETIAMTPANCWTALNSLVTQTELEIEVHDNDDKLEVSGLVQSITGTNSKVAIASSGLSMQYGIMMGLIDDAKNKYPGKDIRFVVPPNCYGGTNDQARRVAACVQNVSIMDLPVDGDHNMVQSVEKVLEQIAQDDAIPFIIAEIPTNPRVEVPDLNELKAALSKKRMTPNGAEAIAPVFILDQTFCPNVQFLGEGDFLSSVKAISYVSGSKFPSGGKCTAGYCVANAMTAYLMDAIEKHLIICDNEATPLQLEILAKQLPSMIDRIAGAYSNTRKFVNHIRQVLPAAKINFVSEELAEQGFTPSVFSLDLPTKGNTEEEKEAYKRAENLRLINLMINKIPKESKFCVSYGQLKGCYWTIPATSTQGTTKEGDKDYIVRVALSANMDLKLHQEVFSDFVDTIENYS